MIALVADKLHEIVELCRELGIRKLDVFGSAVTGEFNPDTSDIDFDDTVGARYMDLAVGLEELLGRSIDLVTEQSIRDPFFRAAIEDQRETVYEARNRQAVA
jgi:predicted nucleotidyltransferase